MASETDKGPHAPLRVGFIGCGRATEVLHLPALARVPSLRVVAATDTDPAALARVASGSVGLQAFASSQRLIADPAVDVVAVCAPPAFHAQLAIEALAAGKHVYVEKPIAVTLADAAAIRQASEQARGLLTVGFNLRSHRLVEAARAAVASGVLGPIELVQTSWTSGFHLGRDLPAWRLDRASGGGAFYEIAVHHVDLLRYILGDEIDRVAADSRSAELVDQDVVLNLRMRSGVLASIAISQRTSDGNDIAIYGQRGMVSFSCYRTDSYRHRISSDLGGGLRARLKERVRDLKGLPAALVAARAGGDYRLSYATHWQRFADAILAHGKLPVAADDGERALEAVTAALRSVEDGSSVVLSDLASQRRTATLTVMRK